MLSDDNHNCTGELSTPASRATDMIIIIVFK